MFTVTSAYLVVETVVRLGTDVGVVHFVATARARGQRHLVADVLWASLVPVLAAAVVGAVAAVAVTRLVIHSLGEVTPGLHPWAISVIVAVAVPVGALYDLLTAATRGLGTARPTVVVERLVRPVLQVVGVVVAVAVGAGALGLVLAWLAPYAVGFLVMTGWVRQLLHQEEVPVRSQGWRAMMPEVWRFTLPRSFASVVQQLLQRLDILLVGALLGAPAAAVYTGATRFVVVGQLGNQALSFTFQPQLARLTARRELPAARSLFRLSTVWIVGLTTPLYLAVCVASPLLAKLLGAHYSSAVPTMVIVTAAMLVASACGMVDVVLITMGRTTWNLWNTVVSLVVNIGIDLWLIPRIGIKGAAIGWAVAIVGNNVVPAWQVRRAFGFTPLSALWLRLLVVAALLFGALPEAVSLAVGAHLAPVLVTLVVALAGYLALVWRWREELAIDTLLARRRA